jgi:hypothetical protein
LNYGGTTSEVLAPRLRHRRRRSLGDLPIEAGQGRGVNRRS